MLETQFADVVSLIKNARAVALKTVNSTLINLYWNIGEYIHNRVKNAEWGQSVVKQLAEFLSKNEPDLKGFSDKNLWRMKQFYESYKDYPKLSPLLREISWTHNLIILSRLKSIEEKEFYLKLCLKEKYSKRELERQISASHYEISIMGNTKLSPVVRVLQNEIKTIFKDTYVFEFLNLSEPHSENDLQKNLVLEMRNFILELGKDFLFISEEYKIQVGNSDFYIDLLFYHRGLMFSCI